MCTGGHARRVSFGRPVAVAEVDVDADAEADIEMGPDTPSSDLQVSTHCALKHLWSMMTVPLYSFVPSVKMGAIYGCAMSQTAAAQFVRPAS